MNKIKGIWLLDSSCEISNVNQRKVKDLFWTFRRIKNAWIPIDLLEGPNPSAVLERDPVEVQPTCQRSV